MSQNCRLVSQGDKVCPSGVCRSPNLGCIGTKVLDYHGHGAQLDGTPVVDPILPIFPGIDSSTKNQGLPADQVTWPDVPS